MQRKTSQPDKIAPAGLGYHMPAEWEMHDAIWLAWPHNTITFPNRIEKVERTYVEIIKEMSPSEQVNLFVKDTAMRIRIEGLLKEATIAYDKIIYHFYAYGDVWFRDYGPIFITNKNEKKLAMVHWLFNAWGGKYKELMEDTNIPEFISQEVAIPSFKPGLVLEGGSIDVNGGGTLLTTEPCLLNKNRNPGFNKEEIEDYLKEYLGITTTIWLKRGIEGDDTDGHVDNIARFVNPKTILCAYEDDKNDNNYYALQENYEILLNSRDSDGDKFNVITIPMPGVVGDNGGRLPASYTNFYLGNGKVLVPIFDHANDKKALNIIQGLFPERKVVGINCLDLLYGLGAIHCITQQQPAV